MPSSRRVFLRNAGLAMVGIGAAPIWLERALYAQDAPGQRKKILVAIFQRGAADGLNIVVPHSEQSYYDLRPTIAIPRPGAAENAAIDLDGHFGLNAALAPLKPLYDQGHLAIVHAVGSPDPTRSHFDAQDYMESGTPGLKATESGWLNRSLPPEAGKFSPVRALSMGATLPRTMRGHNGAIAVESIVNFQVKDTAAAKAFESLYSGSQDQILNGAGKETFEAVSLLQAIQKTPYQPASGADYPKSRFGNNMRQIAQLIKSNVGVEVAFADVGGWDHHVNEAPLLTNLLRDFGQSLAAFHQDLGDRMQDVVLVTMSEFGRTARENGTRGTDHGHANCMFVMGGGVKGGKVHGQWPGMAQEQLYEQRDLALTTDFRAVLGDLVKNHLGNKSLRTVFPNYTGQPLSLLNS
ncbi:MAG: DUF1501 domain-containing protein [Acidobacteriota bacterium]|nr:DUF1501 domain-containing protein [Acidobacteriota bacterium]